MNLLRHTVCFTVYARSLQISNTKINEMNKQPDVCEQEKNSHLFDIKQELN